MKWRNARTSAALFRADATTNLPRPEGLGYSVKPFHGRCTLENVPECPNCRPLHNKTKILLPEALFWVPETQSKQHSRKVTNFHVPIPLP